MHLRRMARPAEERRIRGQSRSLPRTRQGAAVVGAVADGDLTPQDGAHIMALVAVEQET